MVIQDFVKKDAILMLYDIVSYTSYCDYHETRGNHDRVYELVDRVVGGSNEIIRDLGGDPRTFTGDGYISSFDGDASEKAVDAALYIHDMAREIRKDFDASGNPRLKVALYRGPTLFGVLDLTSRPMGRAPCKLSRIESLARPGETLASGSVIDTVIDLYDVKELEGTTLSGIAEQKKIYSVLGKKPITEEK